MSLDVSVDFMRKVNNLQPDLKDILYSMLEVIDKQRQESVTREDFSELKEIVKELGISQQRLNNAQERTEVKVKELAVEMKELADAQKRTEVKMEELAEAQKRTEVKVEELADAQKRTEVKVEELADAQKRTEVELKTLARELKNTQKEVGGLSHSFGYVLENEAYKKLPILLEKDFGITIKNAIKREYISDNKGAEIEVNIFGFGEKNGHEITIIGESKSQLSQNDIDRFIRKKIERLEGLYQEIFIVLVTHMITSKSVETYAKDKGIALYYSYNF